MMYRCLKEDLIYFENCVDFTFLFIFIKFGMKKKKAKNILYIILTAEQKYNRGAITSSSL